MNRQAMGWIGAALVAFLIGCGGGGETKTVTVPADEPAPDGTATAEAEAEASPTPGPDGELPAIAQSKGSVDGERVTVVLTELRRSGPTVVLNARLEIADPDSAAQVGSVFDDGIYQQLADETQEEGDVFDGVAMVDPEGRKKYLVARDEDGSVRVHERPQRRVRLRGSPGPADRHADGPARGRHPGRPAHPALRDAP